MVSAHYKTMRKALMVGVVSLGFLTLEAQAAGLNSRNPFCLLTSSKDQTGNGAQFRIDSAKELGVPYIRFNQANVPMSSAEANRSSWGMLHSSGLMPIQNFRHHSAANEASKPPTDLNLYKQQLGAAIDVAKPTLVVVENEEGAAKFYAGTPPQYIEQLKAAVEVAHKKGYEVTNGGLTNPYLAVLVAEDYLDNGYVEKANDYANRMARGGIKLFSKGLDKARSNPKYADLLNRARYFIAGYTDVKIDYVNFHWYIPDALALEETVNYLRKATGKPAITNEIGQHDKNPATVTALMTAIDKIGVPLACWYDGDGAPAYGLHTSDGSLRESGEAFQEFIDTHY